jgi:sugar phosphate isomerase/epimerase
LQALDAQGSRHREEPSRDEPEDDPAGGEIGRPVVVDFSGCPGDSRNAKRPNWVTCPWPPEYLETLQWQWDKVVEPYWMKHAQFAADHGVKIAIEMHPGFVVYNPETLLRLREIAGPTVG